ncbi:NAD(P)/FAD-dependent oxidoreductase [Pseudomonas sp. PB120]|uniref:NAD(P)/FAD-dependent oxidoreductase n=1 Tax=Pseudomonas sp. PB120 TaxID=2494700 RepID=UPI0012FE75BA|nr:FAD/NAD(P)-binding oxidoreductase [Pseudomonas sp. PB120]MVV48833.1 NAD(P)/FAD-dependent oxidoreductase [Pseudomonas sp. PB120]
MRDGEQVEVLIVGAGQAAGELAVALRQEGHAGRILIVGEESCLPYQRPPLSKAYLAGMIDLQGLLIRPQTAYERAAIDFLLDTRVESIDRTTKQVRLADGRCIRYERLALATGGHARRLSLPGSDLRGIHYLRNLADVDDIRPQFRPGRKLVVIGGGYVGLEVAAVAVRAGLQVTVLETASRVLARVTAPQLSAFYESLHRENGVRILTGIEVQGFAPGECPVGVGEVLCKSGERIQADFVIVGIGLVPNVELAQAAGLLVDNGIVTDETGLTQDPNIVAIGDCANQPSLFYGRRLRLESVPSAVEQARCAAATLCGKPRRNDSLPWFWSDQYDLKLQMAGLSQGYERVVIRGSFELRSFAVFYLQGARIIAADVVGRPADFMAAKRLIAERLVVEDERLADDSQPLKVLFANSVN